MKTIIILVLIVSCFLGNDVSANNSNTFTYKGISLDSDVSELFQKEDLKCKHPDQYNLIKVCALSPEKKSKYATFAGVKVDYILFHIYKNKLVKLFVSTKHPIEEGYKITVDALTEKYGKSNNLKNKKSQLWNVDEYTYRTKVGRYIVRNKAKQWHKDDQYMLYGLMSPAEEVKQDYNNPEQRWGFDPYSCYYGYSNCSTRFDFGLMILSKTKYSTAIKAKLEFKQRKKEEERLQLEAEAINDL